MKVYALWHVYELSDDFGKHDEEKLIGIFSSLEGFQDYPVDCFKIHEMEIDRASWMDGFTTVRYNV